jgi:sugar phosphate isomerase/epimerase
LNFGISTLYLIGKRIDEIFLTLEKHGEECKVWELTLNGNFKLNKKIIKKLLDYNSTYGFKYFLHMPFTDLNLASLNSSIRRLTLKTLKKSLEYAYELEVKVAVIHPGFRGPIDYFYPGEAERQNLNSILLLMGKAEDLGVSLSVENMTKGSRALLITVEDFEKFFSNPELENLKLTLDVGHAHTVGQLNLFLRKFKHKINHVHLHDNDGSGDLHLGLGDGTIKWRLITRELKTFNGNLIIESIEKVYESYRKMKKMFKV